MFNIWDIPLPVARGGGGLGLSALANGLNPMSLLGIGFDPDLVGALDVGFAFVVGAGIASILSVGIFRLAGLLNSLL